MRKARRSRQRKFAFPSTWGGRRRGAGRKRRNKSAVPHVTRPELNPRHPVHVTLRVAKRVWSLRSRRSFRVIEKAFRAGSDRLGMRLTHYSVQGNHIHLIVEAEDRRTLSRAMQGLLVRLSKGLNRLMGTRGSVFPDRYHAQILPNPVQVRRAVLYVLNNARRHGLLPAWVERDPYAAGVGPDGQVAPVLTVGPPPIVAPRTWLLRVGWLRARD